MEPWAAVVLAAGMGTRMRSGLVKVLHPLCGRPMLEHAVRAAQEAGASRVVVVVGPQAGRIQAELGNSVEYVRQTEPRGTGDAVLQTEPVLGHHPGPILITYGDTPLWTPESFRALIAAHRRGAAATLLTVDLPDPSGYGRVVRERPGGRVLRIVEQKDASPDEARIREINTGTYCFESKALFTALHQVRPENQQNELYLTDAIGILAGTGRDVQALPAADPAEALGVNDRVQLAEAEQILRQRVLRRLMLAGVTIVAPQATFIDADVVIGQDSVIYPFCTIEGRTRIGERCRIGPGCHLRDAEIGDEARLISAVAEGCRVEAGAVVGPFVEFSKGEPCDAPSDCGADG